MHLNLQIISDELTCAVESTRFVHDASIFDCAYPLPYRAGNTMEGADDGEGAAPVYIMRADDLPHDPPCSAGISLICIGASPASYDDAPIGLVVVDENTDPFDLFTEVSRIFSRYEQWGASMQRVLDEEQPIRRIGELAQPIVENPIIFGKPGFRCIFHVATMLESEDPKRYRAYCKDFDAEGITMAEDSYPTTETINEMISDPEYQRSIAATAPTIYSGERFGYPSLFLNLGEEGSYVARVTLDGVFRNFVDADFGRIAIIGYYLEKAIRGKDVEAYNRPKDLDDILGNLLAHHLIPEQRIISVLDGCHWDVDDEFFCMVLESKSFDPRGVMLKTSAAQLASRLPSECYTVFDDKLVVVFDITRLRLSQDQVLEQAIPLFRDSFLAAGISTSFRDFKNLFYFYLQGVSALALGMKRDPTFWYFRYDAYQLEDFIVRVKGRQIPEALYPTGLKRLIEYDTSKGSDLVGLLRVYLEKGMNVAETIRTTYMHRNTCEYRLKRIEEIGGFDLTDPDERLKLEIAFKLMDLE